MPYSEYAQRGLRRLQSHDYTQAGAYFVTFCVKGREMLLGEITNNIMHLNDLGRIAAACWFDLPAHFPRVQLDAFVVMPNHVHGVFFLADAPSDFFGQPRSRNRKGLPEIMRAWKSFSARRINEVRGAAGTSVWQRNYYDHVIRDEKSLERIREYIDNNPKRWQLDSENPERTGTDAFDEWLASLP